MIPIQAQTPIPHKFINFLTTGSSTPIVVQSGSGQKYLVKLKGGQSGSFSYLNEWVAGRLGAAIGLPVSVPETILIDEHLEIGSIHEEVKDLIHKSFGLNLAFPFFEEAVPCTPRTAHDVYQKVVQQLYVFDVFLLNTDRTIKNPNLLERAGGVFSFDYETSFLLTGAVLGKDFSRSDFALKALRENPLYRPHLDAAVIAGVFDLLRQADIAGIVDSLPEPWAASVDTDSAHLKSVLKAGLLNAIGQEALFTETLKHIDEITPESEDDKRNRHAANLARFKAGWIPLEILE